ncbi:MAG: alpha/beta hydrolase [Acidimicrobiia bacterium]|nr:MAG: alpha/beta hydrolase [Acidimicrobiia bacterium]
MEASFDVYSSTRQIRRDGVALTFADHGPEGGPAVLLVHGFPDSARLWRNQVPALTEAGFRVLAPDLRGYGRSDKPVEVEAYAMHEMAADLVAVLDAAGVERVHYVGHDWGAAIGWYMALRELGRVASLVALSVGHPNAFRAAGIRQKEKSWYMLLFQFPGVAEEWLSRNDWETVRTWLGQPSEVEHWIADLSRPGALTAALGLYRANMTPEALVAPPIDLPPVSQDVMGVWSDRDGALVEEQMTGSARYVAGEWRYERLEGVSHWIPVDSPGHLNRLLVDWLSSRG